MQIANKQFKIPKTDEISTEYILRHFEGFEVIRWAIVEVTDDFYVVDSAVIL